MLNEWATAVGLIPGDRLLVVASGLQWNESEVVTIAQHGNQTGNGAVELILSSPLLYGMRAPL